MLFLLKKCYNEIGDNMRKRDQLIIYSISLLVLIILFFTNKLLDTDILVYNFICKFITPSKTKFFTIITDLGDYIGIIIATIIILVFNHKHNHKRNVSLILLLILSSLYVLISKNIFQRPRPEILQLIPIDGFSFPSGHSTFSMAIYGYLIYIINKEMSWKIKNIIIFLLTILIFSIGLSRIYLGVHYFSDVFAGFISGLIILNIVLIIENRFIIKGEK